MHPSPVLSVLRAAIPLTFVLILRLCGFWRCPLRLLDDLHALVCRSCGSPECELAPGAGLLEFSCWRALGPSLEVLQRRWLCMGPRARMRPCAVGCTRVRQWKS